MYRVLQGKYNSETRNMRQALMHRDASMRQMREDVHKANTALKVSEVKWNFWKRQAGYYAFVVCTLAVAVLTMWMLVQSKERDIKRALDNCTLTAQDPAFMELPPTRIEGYPAQPTMEL